MTDLGERLRQIRNDVGMDQKTMSRRFGLGDATWQRLELEGRAPKGEVLEQLARDGIDVNWLLTGEGEMHRAGPPALNQRLLAESMAIVDEWLAKHRRTMSPEKRANVTTMIYALVIEENSEGKEIDAQKIGRILHLVA